jgi:hypothetical protein
LPVVSGTSEPGGSAKSSKTSTKISSAAVWSSGWAKLCGRFPAVDEGYVLDLGEERISARFVIAAPGRGGAYWLREVTRNLGIGPDFGPLDVGVRVEFPAEIYEPIERVMYDAKFRVRTPNLR